MSDAWAILGWWLIIQALGLAVWPLAFRVFRWLPDRGYLFAKPLGLLSVGYVLWLLVSFHVLSNTPVGILIAFFGVTVFSQWIYWRDRDKSSSLRRWLREHWRIVIAYEVLFAVALIGWAIFRRYAPDVSSAEKPMEFAFFNAVSRSRSFPPIDPWLSGNPIAYYYFGYVMMTVMSKLSGAAPGVAFSLSNALWFALSAASAFAVVANLVVLTERKIRAAIFTGLLGAVLLVLMGNLEAPLDVAYTHNWIAPAFWQQLDIRDLNDPPFVRPNDAPPDLPAWVPRADWDWWWRASRVINDYPPDSLNPRMAAVLGVPPDPLADQTQDQMIDEFPQFTFILGDLHPHVLDLPFLMLVLGLALNVYQASLTGEIASLWHTRRAPPGGLLYPLIIGALGFVSTWDFPTFAFVVAAAFVIGQLQTRPYPQGVRPWLRRGLSDAGNLIVIGGLSIFAYLPFYANRMSQVAGIWPNLFNGTQISEFFVMFGPFIVIGFLFGLKLLTESIQENRLRLKNFLLAALGGGVGLTILAVASAGLLGILLYQFSSTMRQWYEALAADISQHGITLLDHLLVRLTDPWIALALGSSLVAAWLLWHARRVLPPDRSTASRRLSIFVILLFFTGLLLTFSPELVFIVDLSRLRTNTVFKFYYQAWALWSVAAAYATYYLLLSPARIVSRPVRWITGVIAGGIIGLGLIYPVLAIPTRVNAVIEPQPTLDALEATGRSVMYPNASTPYAASLWLNQNISDSPVILEATDSEPEPHIARSRISTWTGLPTVLGWYWHESLWRGSTDIPSQRLVDVTTIYSTADPEEALTLMKRYQVAYLVIGTRERGQYPPEGLAKFDRMFPIVFQQGSLKIYEVK